MRLSITSAIRSLEITTRSARRRGGRQWWTNQVDQSAIESGSDYIPVLVGERETLWIETLTRDHKKWFVFRLYLQR